ncbi:ATP-binding protein [Scytonema sp. NUACC26]|uniref:ATP-binding protein n=1 Tax=Scytonema sp. NUACC26 TaxID=3140176 RepID=UPI0034DC228B
MLSATATLFLPWSSVALGAGVFTLGSTFIFSGRSSSSLKESKDSSPKPEQSSPQFEENVETQITEPSFTTSVNERLYRTQELQRIVASLKANASILVVGEEGSGKSTLASAVVERLKQEEFSVTYCEPATPKQMLLEIAQQLEVDTQSLEGKALTADQLKRAISSYFDTNSAFLVIDGAQACDLKFRMWLKQLRRQGIPMLLLATDPPRSDIFISLPRIELLPLPEYAIREIMEQAALSRGIHLKHNDLAKLQERAGGNPMLAVRAIDEEYLGLEIEGADHRRYFDITPLILLAGIIFVVMRFIGLGTNNQALYIFGGIAAAVFLGLSRMLYNLPRESRRIQS